MKLHTTYTVEEAIILAFNSRVPARERSKVIETFMRQYSVVDEPSQEEADLEREIGEARTRLEDERLFLSEKIAALALVRQRMKEQEKAEEEELDERAEMIERSGLNRRIK